MYTTSLALWGLCTYYVVLGYTTYPGTHSTEGIALRPPAARAPPLLAVPEASPCPRSENESYKGKPFFGLYGRVVGLRAHESLSVKESLCVREST
jgi:hypothetical protein